MKNRANENFNSDVYFEVTIEEQYTGSEKWDYNYVPVIPVHKNYLNQLVTIYKDLNSQSSLCSNQHPYVFLNDEQIEGMYYYAKDIDNLKIKATKML